MFPEALADRIRSILAAAAVPFPDEIRVARPLRPGHGDYSTPVALRIRGAVKVAKPAELAELIATGLRAVDGIESATVVAPGHVNVRLTAGDLATTARELARRPSYAFGSSITIPYTPRGTVGEACAELARLLRRADALDVPAEPVDIADLAAPDQRRLICRLAETAGIARRKPELLARHLGDIVNSWNQVSAIQPILPKGDEIATSRHSSGRLLAAATLHTLAGVDALP